MAATAPIEEGIGVVRTFNSEVFNERNYDKSTEIQSEEYVQHGPFSGQELHGEESLENLKMFHAAFSDLEATEEFVFSDGEFVCTHYTYSGTHDGDLMGLPATDQRGEVAGTVINRIEDGKIAEAWVLVDFLGLLQQLDVVPDFDEIAS